jgi:hypothetical protein
MNKFNSHLIDKIITSIILISGAIWVGSQITKLLTIYYFFDTDRFGRLFLKPEIPLESVASSVFQMVPMFSISIISYFIFILFTIIYTVIIRKHLRWKGWLFISIVMVLFCVPFEIYLTLIDIKILRLAFERMGNSSLFVNLLESRIIDLASFPLISVFLHLICITLFVFKPLNKEAI